MNDIEPSQERLRCHLVARFKIQQYQSQRSDLKIAEGQYQGVEYILATHERAKAVFQQRRDEVSMQWLKGYKATKSKPSSTGSSSTLADVPSSLNGQVTIHQRNKNNLNKLIKITMTKQSVQFD